MYKKYKIPTSWLNVDNVGNVVEFTNLIPMKVLLNNKFIPNLKKEDYWTPEIFLNKKNLNIGMIIDLTNTTKYYDGNNELENVKYLKLACEGYNSPPSEEIFIKFKQIIIDYNKSNNDNIAIHCTIGFNRTGYLIVRYLVEVYNLKLNDALNIFANARSPGILKYSYIDILCDLYNEDKKNINYPILPEWAKSKYS